ncbi:delta(3,5)-Delta(2,4)-dienoyl-CoA isomerase, mitochondrial [Venturia canescens]|uniref:delta(3,5)-Delta(2,4)-dienoyl-CoA isomerase, mitochondrial n=1 Tax=Venturia canescens TaxID=32260 RepID=UPI001C9C43F1|nr:delta(3,5)-Delta(2,4)-dienoyl-CoA isomerase, mitochondrial [Venturia canescens]
MTIQFFTHLNKISIRNQFEMQNRALRTLTNKVIEQFRKIDTAKYSTAMSATNYETLLITVPKEFVYHVELNRPAKLNALSTKMWLEFNKCFEELGENPDCRAIVLSGAGKLFTAGLDLQDAVTLGQKITEHNDIARKAKVFKGIIKNYQEAFTALEKCEKPVIAAVHNACIGAGLDMISAADIRYCTKDAWFQIKEVDLGMAADVGVLQRLPKIIGSDSLVRELAYTARKFFAQEALECGFVNRIFENKEQLLSESFIIAEGIAKKSPVAIQGTKLSMVYSRDHTVQEGLDHIARRNEAMLQSEDFLNATIAAATKGDAPVFSKL